MAVTLCGVKLSSAAFDELLRGSKPQIVFTPNPEILVRARKDRAYRTVLNQADVLLPDGFGIPLATFLLYQRRIKRYPGIDTAERLLTELNAESQKENGQPAVLLFGDRGGAAQGAADTLTKRFSALSFLAVGDNVLVDEKGSMTPETQQALEKLATQERPQLVFVGLGAPKQEYWIMRHRGLFPDAQVIMAVGGAFNIWSGRLPRAPKILRRIGFEWAWRLLREPKRLPRIFRATVIFPWYVLRERLSRKEIRN